VVGKAIDIGIVASRLTTGSQSDPSTSVIVLSLIALAQTLMVVSIRWIWFRLIFRRRSLRKLQHIAPLIRVAVIFAMVKLIEIQRFRLWSGPGDLGKFLVFLVPSLILKVSMSPPDDSRSFMQQERI